MGRKYEGRHRAPREEAGAEDAVAVQPGPGTAGQAQGQPEAGVDPAPEPPEQPVKLVTGGEALEEQQQNPDLEDNTGARP